MAKFFDVRLLWAVASTVTVLIALHMDKSGMLFLGGYMLAQVTR